jgi:pyroglutamyl-peptidase
MSAVIVAAFEPFDGRGKNRAERAARRLHGLPRVAIASLPVSFAKLPAAVDALLKQRPRLLVLVGESEEAEALNIERFAVNLVDARIADNDGAQPRGALLETAGPTARAVPFAVDRAVQAVAAAEVSVVASAHAGTFCCNAALYHALGRTALGGTMVAFVHVPARKRFVGAGEAARGLRALIDHLVPVDK